MSVYYQALLSTAIDDVDTSTSDEQREVESAIQSLLLPYQQTPLNSASKLPSSAASSLPNANSVPVPSLNKSLHMSFLRKVLDPLPAPYVAFDSTRCWLIYWVAHSYHLMGTELSESLRSRAISTLLHFQDRQTGGFGSGQGQLSHLMATYASIMALSTVGGPGSCPEEEDIQMGRSVSIGKGGWDDIDRPLMYRFLLSLKQPDGAFTVHRDGEIDVRATYCVVCIALMLDIATPALFEGVGSALARCQTYEGGLSAASYASEAGGDGAATIGEAHGGYAFCAFASHLALSLMPNPVTPWLSPYSSDTFSSTPSSRASVWKQDHSASSSQLDLEKALRWAVSIQGVGIEGGGFRGRTNKLVDGCYGWFSGAGAFTVIGALEQLQRGHWWKEETSLEEASDSQGSGDMKEAEWECIDEGSLMNLDGDGVLFDRIALQEYILIIAQAPEGGLRDKPGKRADAYHTCYNLSGLSLCQHRVELDDESRIEFYNTFNAADLDDTLLEWRRCCYSSLLGWNVDTKMECVLGGDKNKVNVTHPIFNVGFIKAKGMMDWAYGQF